MVFISFHSFFWSVAMISMTLSSNPLVHSFASFILLLILLVYFLFHLLCCSSPFFSFSVSLLNISYIFSSVHPFFFWDFRISLLLLLWILFLVSCLSPLHLVVLIGFHLAPSSATHFFVISFCLTYHVCGKETTNMVS